MMNAGTQLYGVIGNPVRRSLSPVIHNNAFKRMGIDAVYLAFEVENITDALRGIRGLGIQGASVTLPFKARVIPLLDGLDTSAGKIGSVNTIVNHGGSLIGHNTDWLGALKALEEKVALNGKRVILLGAGGAARAIAFGLKGKGCQVTIFNRSSERAAELARRLGCNHQPLSAFSTMVGALPDAEILINATSVGMFPLDSQSPVPKRALRRGMTVMDIVYRPLQTRLLQEAREQGCQTIDGIEMLAHQGAAQLEIWTGQRSDIQQIKADLRQILLAENDRSRETS
jgi:shikimate dehydrogenase